jgi:hypothetical protein
MSFLSGLLKVALPAIGTIIAPGIGTALGTAAAGAIGGAESAGKANKNRQAATDLAVGAYNEKKPLRDLYLQQALKGPQSAPNLSRLFNLPGNAANPFFKPTNPEVQHPAPSSPYALNPATVAYLQSHQGQPGIGTMPQIAMPGSLNRPTLS